jgi:oligopeptide transport system ATP-binding protein
MNLLEVRNLKMYFPLRQSFFNREISHLKAVNDISFAIKKGETMGLVGESGCGKTTTGRAICRLYDPTGGEIIFDGENIAEYDNKKLLSIRKKMQMIFQDPYSSLDPRMTVGEIIKEPMVIQNLYAQKDATDKASELLSRVGLKREHLNRYPHEFSGGQRQRVGIARALAMNPEFIICDEPISALDVSIQAQVVNMLEKLSEEFGLTYLFISHDLSMVRHISHKIGVMYLGRLVEYAETDELFLNMLHPYTKALISSVPTIENALNKKQSHAVLKGEVPSPINLPEGCVFCKRCVDSMERCKIENPEMKDIGGGHFVACHLYS